MPGPSPSVLPAEAIRRGIRSTLLGMAVNALLAVIKLVAGLLGNTYALVADAAESMGDLVWSLITLSGLRIASRQPNDRYPYGYGRAETLAAGAVALMLICTGVGVGWMAIHEIQTPHQSPAAWTLVVLAFVVGIKWVISQSVKSAGEAIGSQSVKTEAWHHLSDAITSAAAFIGIAIAVWQGPGWEAADDWAALFAAAIIVLNGSLLFRGAIHDLMDRKLEPELYDAVRHVAEQVPLVRAIEKLGLRRTGLNVFAEIHVQADPAMSLADAHSLGGRVKMAIQTAHPEVAHVLVHMEPFEDRAATATMIPSDSESATTGN